MRDANIKVPHAEKGFFKESPFLLLFFIAFLLITFFVAGGVAYAGPSTANNSGIYTTAGAGLCNVVYMVYGNLGRGAAILAIASMGVGAMFGKISWGLAVTIGTGIGILFGAGAIAADLVGGQLWC